MKDLFGKAIFDFQTNNLPEDLITETSISEADEMSVAYLFRSYDQMPKIERLALDLAYGKVLDAGCGAGSHSLYLLHEKNLDVQPIDISPNAIAACKLRGLDNAHVVNLMSYEGKFDTILLLMNGAGMCGKLKYLKDFLLKLKSLLNDGGQILLDSSDIIYMFDDEDDVKSILEENEYYGEVNFKVTYKGQTDVPFNWMYIDFQTLANAASECKINCELISDGEHYDYLARLTL